MKQTSMVGRLKRVITSKHFLAAIIGIVAIQGLWYAFQFQPSILDEGRHIGFIELYTDRLNPFISEQLTEWDALGEVTREPSYFYYYLMSWPLRFIRLFTDNFQSQVIFLRLINIVFFAIAILLYDKFFKKLGISTVATRLALFFLILTPAVAVLPGAVSYDNLSLLFSGWLLFVAATLLRSKTYDYKWLILLVGIIGFGSVIKYTFLALVLPVLAFVAYDGIRRKKFTKPVPKLSAFTIVLAFYSAIGLGLFIERPLMNQLKYGDLTPSCTRFIDEDRCAKNYVQARNIKAKQVRNEQELKSMYEYTVVDWVPNMIRSQVRLNPWDAPIGAMFIVYSLALYGGVLLTLIYLRDILKNFIFVFLLVSMMVFTAVLFYTNFMSYINLGEVVATSSRYLLPVQPIFMVVVAVLLRELFTKKIQVLVIGLAGLLILFMTSGSVVTYARTADPGVRWSDRTD